MKGICFAVSVGPGDPGLMTIGAARCIERCPVVAAPRTGGERQLALSIAAGAVDLTGKEILPLPLKMSRDRAQTARGYELAAAALARHLAAGRDVALLTLGDASLYATAGYLLPRVRRAGYETRVLPGVPSFCAGAARVGAPLAEREHPLRILPATLPTLADELRRDGGKEILKAAGAAFQRARAEIEQAGLTGRATVVENATLPDERVTPLAAYTGAPGYFTMILVEG